MNTVVPKPKTSNGKINWKGGPAIEQAFQIPDTLIYYISMNLSTPKAYNKLIQCCKYFFEVNPILVAAVLCEEYGKTKMCYQEVHEKRRGGRSCCTEVDLSKISSKFWITKFLLIWVETFQNYPLILEKIYRCDIKVLWLSDVPMSFDKFKFLAQSVQKLVILNNVKIIDKDGKTVLLDEILSIFKKIEYFDYWFPDSILPNVSTLKDISKLKNYSNLKKQIFIHKAPEIYDIKDVSDFLTKKFLNTTTTMLCFRRDVSAEYKSQLTDIQKKIYELKIRNHSVIY